MIDQFTITKLFGQFDYDIVFHPITILTGPNGYGIWLLICLTWPMVKKSNMMNWKIKYIKQNVIRNTRPAISLGLQAIGLNWRIGQWEIRIGDFIPIFKMHAIGLYLPNTQRCKSLYRI